MCQMNKDIAMKKREGGFFKSIWTNLIAPILVGIVLAALAGRLVIQISGYQISIGLTIIITLVFFIVIVISFFLGMGYLIFGFFSLIFRSEMPLIYRFATHFLLKPALWMYNRFQDEETREADKKDWEEVKAGIAKYQERVKRDMERIHNEPPTQSTP